MGWASMPAALILSAIVALLATTATAHAQEAVRQPAAPATASIAGDYVHSEMELVAGIRLNADGTFLYGLTVGALDEDSPTAPRGAHGLSKLGADAIEIFESINGTLLLAAVTLVIVLLILVLFILARVFRQGAAMRDDLFATYRAELKPMAGLLETLPQLGIPFCVASSSQMS